MYEATYFMYCVRLWDVKRSIRSHRQGFLYEIVPRMKVESVHSSITSVPRMTRHPQRGYTKGTHTHL